MKKTLLSVGLVIVLLLAAAPVFAGHSKPTLRNCNACPSYIHKTETVCGQTVVWKCFNTGQNPYTCECYYGNCVEESYYG